MSVPLVHENDLEELKLPGRHLRWLVNRELLNAEHLSVCVVRVAPGETVRPAHAHPNGEEVVYIIRGCGRVMVDGAVDAVKEGTAILFPQGSVHMLQNNGSEEMKAICFYAPASDLSTYKFLEDVEFPTS
jgi:quercetin dioxygenase-like cupin family protein